MSKRERITALEYRVLSLEADVIVLRNALDRYAETVKSLTGKIALAPMKSEAAEIPDLKEIQRRWDARNNTVAPHPYAHPNKWPIPPVTQKADGNNLR